MNKSLWRYLAQIGFGFSRSLGYRRITGIVIGVGVTIAIANAVN